MGISSQRRQQLEQALSRLKDADVSVEFKVKLLREIIADWLPAEHHLKSLLETQLPEAKAPGGGWGTAQPNITNAITGIMVALPLLEELPKTAFPEELGRQIEIEVRQSLNEKFFRSPAFMALWAVVLAGVTVFSYGLYSFNRDVKTADQISRQFETRLNDADAKILASERDLTKRLNGEIDAATAKISEMQSNSLKALSSDLERRINEVESKKRDAIQRIDTQMNDFQRAKDSAVSSVQSQASKMEPLLTAAAAASEAQIKNKTQEKVNEFNQRADQTIAELGKPAIKLVLWRSYYFIVAALILSVFGAIGGAVALVKRRKHKDDW